MPRGVDTGSHPGRQVSRPNFEEPPPHPLEGNDEGYEPDYEAILERRAEKRRPDWA